MDDVKKRSKSCVPTNLDISSNDYNIACDLCFGSEFKMIETSLNDSNSCDDFETDYLLDKEIVYDFKHHDETDQLQKKNGKDNFLYSW